MSVLSGEAPTPASAPSTAGFRIKQSYERVGRRSLVAQGRYAHARHMKQARACTRKLRTNLGRAIREIEREQSQPQGLLGKLLETSDAGWRAKAGATLKCRRLTTRPDKRFGGRPGELLGEVSLATQIDVGETASVSFQIHTGPHRSR